jgi:hypothetical protein
MLACQWCAFLVGPEPAADLQLFRSVLRLAALLSGPKEVSLLNYPGADATFVKIPASVVKDAVIFHFARI